MVWITSHWQRFSPWPNVRWALLSSLTSMIFPRECSSSINPAKSVSPTLHVWSGSYTSISLQVMLDPLSLPLAKILLGQVSQNPSCSWCFLSVIFCPLTPILLLGYKFPLFHVVFEVEPNLSPPLSNSTVVAPLEKHKSSFLFFIKCHWILFYCHHHSFLTAQEKCEGSHILSIAWVYTYVLR